ncbi:MAG: hypothetical protein ACOC44_18660 [Promethearchaeia archaeon]
MKNPKQINKDQNHCTDFVMYNISMNTHNDTNKPAYRTINIPIYYAKNPYIKRWWNKNHDNILTEQIDKLQWYWYWDISDVLIENTKETDINQWLKNDPICQKYAWYNVLMYFSIARAKSLDLESRIRNPQNRTCTICTHEFLENSFPHSLVKRIGINNMNFCPQCLRKSIFNKGENKNKEEIKEYLNDLTNKIEKIPSQSYVDEISYNLSDFSSSKSKEILILLKNKPSIESIKKKFGSWLQALIEAGILEDETRETGRGIQCLAKDGHLCFSLGEKTIDDFLFDNKIEHSKEPYYPESNYRADFKVDDCFIEYFGLYGIPDYDKKIKIKRNIAKQNNIDLIEIYPKDLGNINRLRKNLIEKLK